MYADGKFEATKTAFDVVQVSIMSLVTVHYFLSPVHVHVHVMLITV